VLDFPVRRRRVAPAIWRHRKPAASVRAATDGTCIGPNVGSCGAAAYLRQPVFVSDILSIRIGQLQKCCSAEWAAGRLVDPIMSQDGKVLGTFLCTTAKLGIRGRATFSDRLRQPDCRNRHRARTITVGPDEVEAELRTIIDAIPQLIIAVGADGTFLYANQTLRDYTGLTKEEVRSGGFREVFHPEDSDRLLGKRDAAISRGVHSTTNDECAAGMVSIVGS